MFVEKTHVLHQHRGIAGSCGGRRRIARAGDKSPLNYMPNLSRAPGGCNRSRSRLFRAAGRPSRRTLKTEYAVLSALGGVDQIRCCIPQVFARFIKIEGPQDGKPRAEGRERPGGFARVHFNENLGDISYVTAVVHRVRH